MIKILDFLHLKTAFKRVERPVYELNKLGILRWIIGLFLFVRELQIHESAKLLDFEIEAMGWTVLITIVLFMVGFLLPITTPVLLLLTRYYDIQAGIGTLATDVLAITLIVYLLINSSAFSIDHYLLRLKRVGAPLRKLYGLCSARDAESIGRAYLLGFVIYAIISFVALAYHLSDPYWTQGLTIRALFTNSFLTDYYEFFRYFDDNFPVLFSTISISGGIFQSIFQFFMIPLLLFKLGRQFVIFMGFGFFLISLVLIDLSYLPHIELVLWAVIFQRRPLLLRWQKKPWEDLVLSKPFVPKLFYRGYGILIILFVAYQLFYGGAREKQLADGSWPLRIKFNLVKVGLNAPYVFNQEDLSTGDQWATVHRIDQQDTILTPIIGMDGQRLSYEGRNLWLFSNHNSDILYFSLTSSLRRYHPITKADFDRIFQEGDRSRSIRLRIKYDYNYLKLQGKQEYLVTFYRSNSSNVQHWKSTPDRHQPKIVYRVKAFFDGTDISYSILENIH